MKYLNVFLIVYSLLITNVFGATITDDTLKIGKPGSSANKEITLGTNKKIRANESTGKIEFSNDGSLYKNLGSGSGSGGSSGINLVENDSFEDGLTPGWTSSGGTFTQQTYANSSTDDTKYAQFVATASGQYFETTAKVIPTNFSAGCQADFKKVNTTAANLFKIEVIEGTSTVIATGNLALLSWQKTQTLSFPCPASPATVKVRITSLAAGTILADRGYVGSNQNIVSVAGTKYLGKLKWITTTGCQWSNSSTSWGSFAAVAACPSPIVSGSVVAPATKIPGITIPNFEKGTYQIIASGAFATSTTGGRTGWRIANTAGTLTTASGIMGSVGNGNATYNNVVTGSISNGVKQSNITLEMQTYVIGANAAIDVSGGSFLFSIEVYFTPDDAETAVNSEQSSWFVDVNIGGAMVLTTATSAYTPFESPSLDMVVNPGSAPASIPCSGANISTGLTCAAGSEQVGVEFSPPNPGVYEACLITGLDSTAAGATGGISWVETPNNSQTIIQEGKSRQGIVVNAAGYGYPVNNCGTFTFNDISKRTLRFSYETSNTGIIMALDRSASFGQRDAHIIVRPLLSAYNRPVLNGDQLRIPGAANPIRRTGSVICGTSSSIQNSGIGNPWLSSISNISSGACNITIPASSFASIGLCHISPFGGGTAASNVWKVRQNSATTVEVSCYLNSAACTSPSEAVTVSCDGIN